MFLIGMCSAMAPVAATESSAMAPVAATESVAMAPVAATEGGPMAPIAAATTESGASHGKGIIGRIKQMIGRQKTLGILFVLAVISLIVSIIMTIVSAINQSCSAWGSPKYRKYDKMFITFFISIFVSISIAILLLLSMKYKRKHLNHCDHSSIRERRDP